MMNPRALENCEFPGLLEESDDYVWLIMLPNNESKIVSTFLNKAKSLMSVHQVC